MSDAPRWIRTPDDMGRLAATLARARAVSIDTEADSLHHYPGKLCLVQIATDAGEGHLVDPLLLADLSALAARLAAAGVAEPVPSADLDGALDFTVQAVCPGIEVTHGDLPRAPAVIAAVTRELAVAEPAVPGPEIC